MTRDDTKRINDVTTCLRIVDAAVTIGELYLAILDAPLEQIPLLMGSDDPWVQSAVQIRLCGTI